MRLIGRRPRDYFERLPKTRKISVIHRIKRAYVRHFPPLAEDCAQEACARLIASDSELKNALGPFTWGLAAAALIALFILVRGVFDVLAPRGEDATVSGIDPSYQTASESTRTANIRPANPAAEQASRNAATAAHSMQIAVPSFAAVATQDADIGRKIAQAISANLGRSALFTVIDATSFADRSSPVEAVPALSGWQQIGAQALLTGRVTESSDGLEISVALWDLSAGRRLLEKRFAARPESFRAAADEIAEMINAHLTGSRGK